MTYWEKITILDHTETLYLHRLDDWTWIGQFLDCWISSAIILFILIWQYFDSLSKKKKTGINGEIGKKTLVVLDLIPGDSEVTNSVLPFISM
jgi:hypothetical protein